MDPQIAMEAAKEGAKALTKFQEIVQKLFGPMWTRKQADADAYADAKKLQTIRDNPDMEIIYTAEGISARKRDTQSLICYAEQRLLNEAIRQEENLEEVLDITRAELQEAEVVLDKEVDEDWLTRFFSIVKDVSKEEMQYVWGKILAGEIKKPGSFSQRTLETIRNISSEEALIFKKIVPFLFRIGSSSFVTQNTELLEKYGIYYHDIMALDECGLIKLQITTGINMSVQSKEPAYSKERIISFRSIDNETRNLEYQVFPLTLAGHELYQILDYECNNDYAIDLAEDIIRKNKHLKMKAIVFKIEQIGKDGTLHYEYPPVNSFSTADL